MGGEVACSLSPYLIWVCLERFRRICASSESLLKLFFCRALLWPDDAIERRVHVRGKEMKMTGVTTALSWILRITAAAILLQTLFFKFSAAPESVYIFTRVGAEPWGRIGSGIVELIAAV